jgi:hypothetical protein
MIKYALPGLLLLLGYSFAVYYRVEVGDWLVSRMVL